MSRETAYVALFALLSILKTNGLVRLCDRRARLLDGLSASELPALFMAVDHQQITRQAGQPPKRQLAAKVYLYASNPDRHRPAGVILNDLIDAVEAALAPPVADAVQQLGGAVAHAWIEGPIQIFEGPDGQRAAAILSVQMLVP